MVKRLSAEQALDAISSVEGLPTKFNGYPLGVRAGQLAGVRAVHFYLKKPSDGDRFVRLFGKPDRLISSESERSGETTFAQILELAGGPTANDLLKNPENRIGKLLAAGKTPAEVSDDLYWSAFSHGPTEHDKAAMMDYLKTSPDARRALEDIAWGLLNSQEFLLRH
jgi:hypothetical protein